ncbi:MAG: hypothetical protein AB7Q37_18575 [Pyrinomonadaceae bacterium]
MDDIQELYQLAKDAIAAGDEQMATAAMDRIEALKGAPESKGPGARRRPEMAVAAGGGGPRSGNVEQRPYTFGIPTALTPEERAANSEATATLGKGLARGASRVLTGPGQMVTAAAQAMGIPGADVGQYTSGAKQLESDVLGPTSPEQEMIAPAGAVGAGLAVNPAMASRTILGGIGRSAAMGALGGATTLDTSAETPGDVGWNTLLGASAGAVLNAIPATAAGIKNKLSAWFNQPPSPETARALEELAKTPEFKQVALEAGQRTGNRTLQNMVARVAATRARNFYSDQIKQTTALLKGNLRVAPRDENTLAYRAGQAFHKLESEQYKLATKAYGENLDEVTRLASASKTPPIPMADVARFVGENVEGLNTEMFRRFMDPAAAKYYPEFARIYARVVDAAKEGKMAALSLNEIVTLNRAARSMRRSLYRGDYDSLSEAEKSAIRKGRDFIEALDGDTTLAIEAGAVDRAGQEALDKFAQGNADYKAFWDTRKLLQASAMGQLFGRGPVRNPEQAIDALLRSPPSQQVIALNAMRKLDPQLVGDMKAWQLNRAFDNAVDLTNPASVTELEPDKLVKALTEGNRVIAERFWTPAELQHIRSGLAALRLIGDRLTSSNRGVEPKALGVALASQSKVFAINPIWQMLGAGRMERWLLNPTALTNLRVIANTINRPTAATAKALGYLAAQMNNPEEKNEEPRWIDQEQATNAGLGQ